jgi:hypothetical protein
MQERFHRGSLFGGMNGFEQRHERLVCGRSGHMQDGMHKIRKTNIFNGTTHGRSRLGFFPSTKVDFTISLKNGFLGFWNFDTNGLMNVFDHVLVKIKERSNDSIAFGQFEKERT